ncbi:MAG: hypothetical protein V1763_01540, partial [Parcubacteria group bacterium]
DMERLVTITTRTKRPNEQDGVDYHIITEQDFQKRLAQNDLFEHAEVYGNHYGNSRGELQKIWDKNKIALAVVDIQGAMTIKKAFPEATYIFIEPDSLENLKERIRQRPMTDEAFAKRWATVQTEMAQAKECNFRVTNVEGKLGEAVAEVKNILETQPRERIEAIDESQKIR